MRTVGTKKQLLGKLSITRSSDDLIRVSLEDALSGTLCFEVVIPPEQFALALTNLGNQPCNFALYDTKYAGKKHEIKTEVIPGISRENFQEVYLAAVASYEIDGWEADLDVEYNSHRQDKDRGYAVVFRRYVDVELGDADD